MADSIAEVKEQYTVDNDGVIRSPGRYEGDSAWIVIADAHWTEYGWESFYNPATELTECAWSEVDDEMRKGWELEDDTAGVAISFSDVGFVYATEFNSVMWAKFQKEIEEANKEFEDWDE